MIRQALQLTVAWGVLACGVEAVHAQTRGGTTAGGISAGSFPGGTSSAGGATSASSGMFGARSFGTSISAGNRSFGGTSRGGVAGATQRVDSTQGQVAGNERFIRGNRQGNQFVGSDAADLGRFVGALAGASGANQGQGARGAARDESNANRGAMSASPGQQRYRTVRSVAFDYPQPDTPRVGAALAGRFQSTGALQKLGPIAVQVQGRTAILRGEVATDHDRVIAEKLALLEAGISDVQNELTVAPPTAPRP